MSEPSDDDAWQALEEELQNFQEIATCLNPSPGEIPALAGVEISGWSLPLRGLIGGDHIVYVDFKHRFDLPSRIAQAEQEGRPEVAERLRGLEHRAGILVVDVSGHRMTDALIAAMLHQAFLLGLYYELDLFGHVTTRIFEHINTRFYRTTAVNKYFTMIYGEIIDDGTFRFLSAGHHPPAVFSREFGRFVRISADRLVSFPPVGMLPSKSDPDERIYRERNHYKKAYEVNEISLLSPGDILLVHTDGLSDHAGGAYFPAKAEALLGRMRGRSAQEIAAELKRDILAHGAPQDDVSLVVIRRTL